MDISKRSAHLTISGFIIFLICMAMTPMVGHASHISSHSYDPDEVRERVLSMNSAIAPRYTNEVAVKLKSYLVYARSYTERLLGKRSLYFHIFEKHLAREDLPDDLKYLTVVESGLVPNAKSSVGAVGLWQFMPSTARERGLRITRYIDERRDPELATQAAVKHLKYLYGIYGDWALTIAAYNSGPGRVNRAIRLANSTDFWEIRGYLPRETRNYVPAFIAATYLFKHYKDHDLEPKLPDLDYQFIESEVVFDRITISDIATLTGLSRRMIHELNPMYRSDLIPATQYGLKVRLPIRVMALFRQKYGSTTAVEGQFTSTTEPVSQQADSLNFYKEVLYEANSGEILQEIADFFDCHDYQIKYWNDLDENVLARATALTIYLPFTNPVIQAPVNFVTYRKTIEVLFIERPSSIGLASFPVGESLPVSEIHAIEPRRINFFDKQNTFHRLRRGETLKDVARQYSHLDITDILRLNNIRPSDLRPGLLLQISK
jgi:membrane-bound lytic murein transglycosylase D